MAASRRLRHAERRRPAARPGRGLESLLRVDIDHIDQQAGSQPDVGLRPEAPPSADLGELHRCIEAAAGSADRDLAPRLEREDGQAALCIPERGLC